MFKKHAHLIIIDIKFLKWVDGDENVPNIGVDQHLLVPFPQLGHQQTLEQ